ncbi:MAG: hypothetical protein RJA57_427 [Bacteroidota bacterium]|jgi:Zn-dependent protease
MNFEQASEGTNTNEPGSGTVLAATDLVLPKFKKNEDRSAIWMRSFLSLALYLLIGYYIFPSYRILLLVTAIVLIHEMGHFLTMKWFRYTDMGLFFIPLLGAYVSGSKREVSQRESAIILLAGPLPGILIGTLFYLLWQQSPYEGGVAGISYYTISILFIFLNLLNLLPVYPLDGGQLLNRVFLDEDNWLSKAFIVLSAALLGVFAWKNGMPVLYVFPVLMLTRLAGDRRMQAVEKRVEAEGIHRDLDYDDLPDTDYWKLRNILAEEHPAFRDIGTAPPYTYHRQEEKVMTAIEGLLHRHLIQDVSIAGKIFILLLWAAALAAPWLLQMDTGFFRRFGL